MMQVRCQKCGWSFTLSRDAIETIMNEVQESKATHYTIDCPKCRHGIKVQAKRIKRFYRPQVASETADQSTE